MVWIAILVALVLLGVWALVFWGSSWGSTAQERALQLPGDAYFEGDRRVRVAMTRAISIKASPQRVWPWIAQLGRGAGWYSVDWLDNGRKGSAWHIVSWIPAPQLGDAGPIGYLRHLVSGQSLAWWVDEGKFLGAPVRFVACYRICTEGGGTRLISRMSADAIGPTAHLAFLVFRVIDSIMACAQLIGLRNRVEYWEQEKAELKDPETGNRDQYQLYEVFYANGDCAGVAGKENGARCRKAAIRDGVIEGKEPKPDPEESKTIV